LTGPVILIAHRGNTRGPQRGLENRPSYIDVAIAQGFQVEIDLWVSRGSAFLGHDGPQYEVGLEWLTDRQAELWVHCKNGAAISFVVESELNWFYHETDPYTVTSHGFIWTYPGKQILKGPSVGLWFGPETPLGSEHHKDVYAICGDYVGDWKNSVS